MIQSEIVYNAGRILLYEPQGEFQSYDVLHNRSGDLVACGYFNTHRQNAVDVLAAIKSNMRAYIEMKMFPGPHEKPEFINRGSR